MSAIDVFRQILNNHGFTVSQTQPQHQEPRVETYSFRSALLWRGDEVERLCILLELDNASSSYGDVCVCMRVCVSVTRLLPVPQLQPQVVAFNLQYVWCAVHPAARIQPTLTALL